MSILKESNHFCAKPVAVKEYAIEQLKKGYSAPEIIRTIRKLYGMSVEKTSIYAWRDQYSIATGKSFPYKRRRKPLEVKEYAIAQFKVGSSATEVTETIQRLFKVYVHKATVHGWHEQHKAISGKQLQPTTQQSSKNISLPKSETPNIEIATKDDLEGFTPTNNINVLDSLIYMELQGLKDCLYQAFCNASVEQINKAFDTCKLKMRLLYDFRIQSPSSTNQSKL